MQKTLGNIGGRQPETTGDNLKTEVVSPLGVDNTGLTTTGDSGDNLFVSYACEGKESSIAYILYGRSWQKVVSTVSLLCNTLKLLALSGDNLKTEVVSGCLPGGVGRAI